MLQNFGCISNKKRTTIKHLLHIAFGIAITLIVHSSYGQYNDFQLWTGASIQKKTDIKLTFTGKLQGRFGQNASLMEKYLAEAGMKYKLTKIWYPGIRYRLSNFGVINTQRIDIDNYFTLGKFNDKVDLRIKYQHRFSNRTQISKDRLRFRLQYEHKFSKKFRVYASAEYFYTMYFRLKQWDTQRYTGGMRARLFKDNFLDVFYRHEREQNVENPERSYILGISWLIRL